MDKIQDPLIFIDVITLINAHVELVNPSGSSNYHVAITELSRTLSEDGLFLTITAGFDAMYGVADPKFRLTAKFCARYRKDKQEGLSWDAFSNGVALAHTVPYLREFISNMTGRLPLPPLYIKALNTFLLVEDFNKRQCSLSSSD